MLHFKNPKVQANLQSKVIAISGHSEEKQIVELLPGIVPHLSSGVCPFSSDSFLSLH